MDRPALAALLREIDRVRIDVVVVYKVDRLARSLTDFAKIVEVLHSAKASCVSVTQACKTTTSLGRLTLNVLSSFAQFEREVTGERIRDKIAASKARGMWMGGNPPLGYDVGARELMVNEEEAEKVRSLFEAYLELGGVPAVARWAKDRGIRSKLWTSTKGRTHGGAVLRPGQINHIFRNRIYVGEIEHRRTVRQGNHHAIVERKQFDEVQHRLDENRSGRKAKLTRAASCPLAGKVFDAAGEEMAASFSHDRGRKIYRYYISHSKLPYSFAAADGDQRVSAERLERLLINEQRKNGIRGDFPDLLEAVRKVVLKEDTIELAFSVPDGEPRKLDIDSPPLMRGRTIKAPIPVDDIERRQVIADLLRTAHHQIENLNASPVYPDHHLKATAPTNEWTRERMAIPFLAPDIQKAILAGDVPATWNRGATDRKLPLA